jgi:hypothetical protein
MDYVLSTKPRQCAQDITAATYNVCDSLKPSGKYMYHLLYQSVTLFLYVCVLYDSQCKQRLFP